jgi:hypothetical protein
MYVSITLPVTNKRLTTKPKRIQIPNGSIIESTHEADLIYLSLRKAARHADVVPGLFHYSLMSVGTLVDAGYIVIFDKTEVRIMDGDHIIMRGQRHPHTGLWHMKPQKPQEPPSTETTRTTDEEPQHILQEYAGAAIGAPTTAAMIKFDHAALFSPSLSTLNQALDNHWLLNFPGLSRKSFQKHPPKSAATDKGHLDQQRKNSQSTKPKEPANNDDGSDIIPTGIDERTHLCYAATVEATGQVFSDQTGRFVTPSS